MRATQEAPGWGRVHREAEGREQEHLFVPEGVCKVG